jgi:hypothetical protein
LAILMLLAALQPAALDDPKLQLQHVTRPAGLPACQTLGTAMPVPMFNGADIHKET